MVNAMQLSERINMRQAAGFSITAPVPFKLAAQMRARGVTIAELARALDVTQQRVRDHRAAVTMPLIDAWSYQEMIERLAVSVAA